MQLGDCLLENFLSSVFQTMQLRVGWQAVAILYIETVYAFMGRTSFTVLC